MLKTELLPSQVEAVAKSRGHDGFAFFSEQRTGKSLAALAVADERQPSALLIVCPKQAEWTWYKELAKHTPDDWIPTYIVTMGVFSNNRHAWKKWAKRTPNVMMIVDESHKIKKRGSKQSRACRLVSKYCDIRILLTGTPIAQGIQDGWAQFDCMMPGLLGTYAEFEEKYLRVVELKGAEGKSWKKIKGPKPEMVPAFNEIYHEYVYRITLNEARQRRGGKAIKTRRVKVPIELPPDTRAFYKEFKKNLEAEYNDNFFSVDSTLARAMKLQQLTGGFMKDEDGEWHQVSIAKLMALEKVLSGVGKRKIVIVCRFIPEIEAIKRMVLSLGLSVLIIRGGHPYKGEFNVDVIIIQVQAGIAIDLAAAGIIIFYSCDYSYIDYEQIRYRIRSYDTLQVTEYFLICVKTVDELIYRAITEKRELADLINEEYRRGYDGSRGASTTGQENPGSTTN